MPTHAIETVVQESNYDIIRDLLFSLSPLLEIRDLFLSLAEGQCSVRYIDGVEMVAIATTTPSKKISSPYTPPSMLIFLHPFLPPSGYARAGSWGGTSYSIDARTAG
jgi:hypothetical protein